MGEKKSDGFGEAENSRGIYFIPNVKPRERPPRRAGKTA